ncbi:MAG: hypothetical protein QOH00_196 [Gaiellales bacterium]|nr:hypothetical protein [Gaiellales bacterium]
MRAEDLPLLGFAAAVLAFDAVLWSYHPGLLAGLLLIAPAAAAAIAAIAIIRHRRPSEGRRVVPDLSLATALCAAALATIALAAIFGLWLLLIGLGLGALGCAGIVREFLASARAQR